MAEAIVAPCLHVIPFNVAERLGMARYFNGVPCSKGHLSERYTKGSRCCECARIKYAERYRAMNGVVHTNESLAALRTTALAQGKKTYKSPKACKKCGSFERLSDGHRCAACRAAYLASVPVSVRTGYARKLYADRNKRRSERRRTDPMYRANVQARTMLQRVLLALGTKKAAGTFEMLGYTAEQFRVHIEKQFTKGMSWAKVGKEIHIDHIISVAKMIGMGITDISLIIEISIIHDITTA